MTSLSNLDPGLRRDDEGDLDPGLRRRSEKTCK